MKSRLIIGVVIACWAPCCLAQRFVVEAANHDPAARTPEEIAEVNQTLAAQGNKQAAWELGLAYLQGYGVEQDLAKAEHWFEIGATDPDEQGIVAGLYEHGEYFPHDLDAAARWAKAAGRPQDQFELAQAYRLATPPQTEKAIAVYVTLLVQTGHPEVRRAQMELGNFVLDGKYSAGSDAKGRALNLEWARTIAQELLGQEEYKIAVDYSIGREDLPADESMWLRFCKRAAAYNIDLAQHFYVEAMGEAKAPDLSGYDEYAWTRLASEKQAGDIGLLKAMQSGMTQQQRQAAGAAYNALVETRRRDGAYYPKDDPLRSPSGAALAVMPQDDPDVQLREAFVLERRALTDESTYKRAMNLYRSVRDRREMDIRFILGRDALHGTHGVPKSISVAQYWLGEAAARGSKPAQDLLAGISSGGAQ
jgi:uncharacterized protein